MQKDAVRQQVWAALRSVAQPDSRFHWNFAEFIPDFEGSDRCADLIREMACYRGAQRVFITPDNSLAALRQYTLADQKPMIVSTYGIARGFMRIHPQDVPPGQEKLAATLDGMEYFGQSVSLDDIAAQGPFNLLVTGAAALTETGIRWGKGHGYFDLEWAMFREIGVVDEGTPIIAVGHDCQVVTVALEPSSFDTIVDCIVTPTRVLTVPRQYPKPTGLFWDHISPAMRAQIPPLQVLYARRNHHGSLEGS